jgi:UDP-glucuronate decarboxylase
MFPPRYRMATEWNEAPVYRRAGASIVITTLLYRARARFTLSVRAALRADSRRIIVVGARGWIGRNLLALLWEALGPQDFSRRVVCFGSARDVFEVDEGVRVTQQPVSALAAIPYEPSLLFHLAFLTQHRLGAMDAADYARANRALSATVVSALPALGVDRLFVASSGAAALVDDPATSADMRLYGRLKREDEARFRAWCEEQIGRRCVMARIHSVSGPYMNKVETYALSSFILDALAAKPVEIRATRRTIRSYVALRELMSLALALLLAEDGAPLTFFDSGGEPLEIGALAETVAQMIGRAGVRRAPITDAGADCYHGDGLAYARLLAAHGVESVRLREQIEETASYFLARRRPP